jgi:hypothetical protein
MKFTVMFRLMLAWTRRQRSERQWPLLWTSTRFFNPFSFSTIICVWLYYVPWVYWRPVNCWVFNWMHTGRRSTCDVRWSSNRVAFFFAIPELFPHW